VKLTPDFNTSLVETGRVEGTAFRVARRFVAKEFPNERALKQYLKEHPQADTSKHFVEKGKERKKGEPPPLPEKRKKSEPPPLPEKKKSEPPPLPKKKSPEPKEEPEHDDDDETSVEKVVGKLRSFGEKAMQVFYKAPKAAQDFVTDPAVRSKAIETAVDTLKKAPRKLVHNLIETAKHEVHEFKEASEGVKEVLKGGKMSKQQRKAFRTVAFHMGLTAAAAALTATGPLSGAASMGKAIARHIAAKAVHNALGRLHVMDEIGHVGHGIAHVLTKLAAEQQQGKPEKLTPEEVMAQFIMAAVAKEIEQLDTDGIGEALEAAEEEGDEDASGKA